MKNANDRTSTPALPSVNIRNPDLHVSLVKSIARHKIIPMIMTTMAMMMYQYRVSIE